MSKTVIIGGSVAGLGAALALAELGHEVRILERDPQPAPGTVTEAHRSWHRPTVPQAAHSHAFGSLGTLLLAQRAPDIYAALVGAGAREIRLDDPKPPGLADRSPQPGDEDLVMLGSRRSTFELVLRREVLRRPGVTLDIGATVRGVRIEGNGSPRATGVTLQDGRTVPAELVLDASGRRSALSRWLTDAGQPAGETVSQPAEITYYTRYYQLTAAAPPGPLNRGFGAGGLWEHYTGVLFLGDNGTFSISLGVLPDDAPLKALRSEAAFTAAVAATPLLAPWIAPGNSEPISPVYAMGGLDNSLRTAPADGPLVAGLYPVGDAVCTTNPAYGRGVSLALAHAFGLADVLAAQPSVDAAQAREVARLSERLFRPWFEEAVANDRGRAMLWGSTVAGRTPPSPPPGVVTFGAVAAAAATDAVVWRRLVRVMMTLDPPSTVYADDEVRARIGAALRAAGGGPHFPPAPDHDQLVSVVTGAG